MFVISLTSDQKIYGSLPVVDDNKGKAVSSGRQDQTDWTLHCSSASTSTQGEISGY